jgi:hypothetical protein
MTSSKPKKQQVADTATSKQSPRSWWFWVWLVQITAKKLGTGKLSSSGDVWENLVLISATNAEEAYLKAIAIGKAADGDCNGTLRLDGAPAYTQFLGIADLGLVHDGIEDGTEILFRQNRASLSKARSKLKSRRTLIARAAKELTPYQSL